MPLVKIPGVNNDQWHIPNRRPERHYRWIKDSAESLQGWLRSYGDIPGYQLVQGATVDKTIEEAEHLGLTEAHVDRARNRITSGMNILASIPIEEAKRRKRASLDEQLSRVHDTEQAFEATADGIPGVNAFRKEHGEIQERAEYARREGRPTVGQVGGSRPQISAD